jgi:hypothetical protein
MSDNLKDILKAARENGATLEQLSKIAEIYSKKKDSTESPSTGEEETTSGVFTEEPKADEESTVEIPNWMRNFQDKAPKVKYEVKGVSENAKKPTETQEDYVQRVAPTEGEKAFQSRVADLRAELGVETYDSIYDEAGIPEGLRPEKGSGVSVLLEHFDLQQAGKSREADQAIDEYESLFRGKKVPYAAGGYGTIKSVEATPDADMMTESELELKRQEALGKVNSALKEDFQDIEEAKSFVYDKYDYHKANLAEMSLEKAKQSYIDDKALFSKGEQVLSLALGKIGWDGKLMQTDAPEYAEGFFNAVADPVIRNIGLNAAIATMDAMGNGYGAELLQAEKDLRSTQGLLKVGLDPQDSRGITETWEEGDKGLAVLKAMYFGSQSMGLMAATIAQPEVGLTMMGVSSSLESYDAFRDRLDLSAEDKNTLAISAGVVEVAMGKVLGGLSNVRRFRSAMGISDDIGTMSMTAKRNAYNRAINYLSPYSKRVKEALKSPAVRGTGRFVYDTGAEAVEELGVELFNQTLAHAIAGEDFDPYALADATLLGGMIGAPMAAVTGAKAYGIESHFFNKPLRGDMEAYETLQTQYADLKQAAREEKDPAKKKIILEEAAKVRAEGQQLIEKANKAYDSLTFGEREQLSKINKGITRLVDEIKSTDNKTIKSRRKNELVGLLVEKGRIEAKAGLDLQLEESQARGIDEIDAKSIVEERTTEVEGVPLMSAMQMIEDLKVKRKQRVKEAESRERSSESPIENSLNKRVRYINPATNETVEGVLAQDGQSLVVETDEGNIIELGQFESLKGRSHESLDVSAAQGLLQVNEDGSFTYMPVAGAKGAAQGVKMYNRNGFKAIRRDKNGNVKNVLLTNEDGSKTYNLKGEEAEEAAYQILLKETQTPEGQAKVDEALSKDAEDANVLEETRTQPQQKAAEETVEQPQAEAQQPQTEPQQKVVGAENLSVEANAVVARFLSVVSKVAPNQSIEVLDSQEAVIAKWKELGGNPNGRPKSFNDPNTQTIYISKDLLSNLERGDGKMIVRHEFMHPIIDAMFASDPTFRTEMVGGVLSILNSISGTNPSKRAVFNHARKYNTPAEYTTELVVEFFNQFSTDSNFDEAIKANPTLMQRLVDMLNKLLSSFTDFRFNVKDKEPVKEALKSIKQSFDNAMPFDADVLQKNMDAGLQAYVEGEPVSARSDSDDLKLNEISEISYNNAEWYEGASNAHLLESIELVDESHREIIESFGFQDSGYKANGNPVYVSKTTQPQVSNSSKISSKDFIKQDAFDSKDKSSFKYLADRLGMNVVYINRPDIDSATTLLMPTSRTGLSEPTIAINIAHPIENVGFYGMGSFIVDAIRVNNPEIIGSIYRRFTQYRDKIAAQKVGKIMKGESPTGQQIQESEYESSFMNKLAMVFNKNSTVYPTLSNEMLLLNALSEVVSEELISIDEEIKGRDEVSESVDDIIESFFSEVSSRAAGAEKAAAMEIVDIKGLAASQVLEYIFSEKNQKRIGLYKESVSKHEGLRKQIVDKALGIKTRSTSKEPSFSNYTLADSFDGGSYNTRTVTEAGDKHSANIMSLLKKIYSQSTLEKINAKGTYPDGESINDEIITGDRMLYREYDKMKPWYKFLTGYEVEDRQGHFILNALIASGHNNFFEDNKSNNALIHSFIADRFVAEASFEDTFRLLFEGDFADFMQGKIPLNTRLDAEMRLEALGLDMSSDENQSMLDAIRATLNKVPATRDLIENLPTSSSAYLNASYIKKLIGRYQFNLYVEDFEQHIKKSKEANRDINVIATTESFGKIVINYEYYEADDSGNVRTIEDYVSLNYLGAVRDELIHGIDVEPKAPSISMFGRGFSRSYNNEFLKNFSSLSRHSNVETLKTSISKAELSRKNAETLLFYDIVSSEELESIKKSSTSNFSVFHSSLYNSSPIAFWNLLSFSKNGMNPKMPSSLESVYEQLYDSFNGNAKSEDVSEIRNIYDVIQKLNTDADFKSSLESALWRFQRKQFKVTSDSAPEGLRELEMYISASGSVSFGVEKWGEFGKSFGTYQNIPSRWGYSRAVSKEVNSFLEELAKEISDIDYFSFSPVSTNLISEFDPNWIGNDINAENAKIKNSKDAIAYIESSNAANKNEAIARLKEDIRKVEENIEEIKKREKYFYTQEETRVKSNFLRKSLYNAWATKAFGGALHMRSRAISLVNYEGNVYVISNNLQDRKAFPQLFIHPKDAKKIFAEYATGLDSGFKEYIKEAENSGKQIPQAVDEKTAKKLIDYFGFPYYEDNSSSSSIPVLDRLLAALKDGIDEISYTVEGEQVDINEIMKTISNDKGVFDFVAPPMEKSELQAYMEGSTDGSDVIEALEELRKEEKEIIEKYTKKKPFSLDNIKGRIFNRYQGLRDAINSGLSAYTRSLLTKRTGYTMYADKMFRDYDKKIFNGLTIGQEVLLDDIIHLRRIIQIDSNFDKRRERIQLEIENIEIQINSTEDKVLKSLLRKQLNKKNDELKKSERPLHPKPANYKGKNIDKEEAIKGLAALEAKITPKEFEKLNKRANAYFDAHRDMLAYARDIGLINEETYDRFSSDDYSPRIFLEKMFGDSPEHTFRGTRLDEEYIKAIKNGSDLAMFTDARQLLSMSLRAIRAKDIQNQLTKSMHNDAMKKNYAGIDFMKPLNTKTVNGKTSIEPADKGFVNAYYRVDGELNGFQIKSDLYRQLTGNVKNYIEVPAEAKKFIRVALGVPLLKALATGVNTAFAITSAMRYVPEAVLGRGVYDKYRFLPLMAGAATIDILSATKDAIFNKSLVEEYLSAGGETIWMSSYGRPDSAIKRKNRSMLASATNKIAKAGFDKISWAANKSELAARLALYKRAKDNLYKEFGNKLTEEQIRSMAVEEAIMLADFATSGTLSKNIDMVSPYFNPAVQGFRGAASYIKSNPKQAGIKMSQFFASSFAVQLVAMLSMDDDEWDRISDYQKMMYLHIPLGRDENGDMKTFKLPRAHNFIPVSSLATIMAQHTRDIIRGKEIKADKDSKDYKSFEDGKYLIESFMKGVPVPSAAPLINAYMVVNHNIDMWRGEKVNYESDEIRDYVKGIYDDNIRDFYKYIALKAYDAGVADLSPRTMQTAVEKFITNDRNFLVNQAYSIADALAIHGGKLDELMEKHGMDYKAIDREKSKIINSLFGVKGRIYTIPKSKFKDSARVKGVSLDKNTKMYKMKKNIRESAIEYSKQKGTVNAVPKDVIEKINSMTENPFERKALISWWKYYYRGKLVPQGIADIMFSESAEEKLAKIEETVGDVSELDQQDYLDLMKNLATAGMRKDLELNRLLDKKRRK